VLIRRPPPLLCALCVLCVGFLASGCGGGGLFKQYEYEEEMYLSLDGSATLYVNSSIAALTVLRGAQLDADPNARVDRAAIREFYSSANTHVTRVSESRRSGRRFVHVRMDVDDVRKLSGMAPFAWSTYQMKQSGGLYIYQQTIGPPPSGRAGAAPGGNWSGQETVAFRMHLPSKIAWHNTPTHEVGRGNILAWEQPLADRVKGIPIEIEARMETQSILYRTLWLFGLTAIAALAAFAIVIWWIMRGGKKPAVV
jgi:hypothetical protein